MLSFSADALPQMLKRAEFGEIASVFTAMAVRSAEAASSAESVSGYDGYVKYPLVSAALSFSIDLYGRLLCCVSC